MRKVFIIAEAGVNHNGSSRIAKRLVDIAASSGADAVKFQTFKAESLVTRSAPKARYQKRTTGRDENQFQMIKRLEMAFVVHKVLIKYCRQKKITFLSSPFDSNSVGLLVRLGLKILKIPSGEITNLPYLRKVGSSGRKIIMSTGAATFKEVADALRVLIKSGARKKDITLLQCNTEYPTPIRDANLLAMLTMKRRFGVSVGYSDHTLGIEAAIAAAALGASVIEKHFTIDPDLPGPDHKASLGPEELRLMVRCIRNVELALGSGIKRPSPSEVANIPIVRKSIVAARDIAKGEPFTEDNLTAKRPGIGITPMWWDRLQGRTARQAFVKDDLIKL